MRGLRRPDARALGAQEEALGHDVQPNIDRWYTLGRENGALGGKLVGAGAGGFLLFYTREPRASRRRWPPRGWPRCGSASTMTAASSSSGPEPRMQCVILAGGIGSRMWPETRPCPRHCCRCWDTVRDWQLSWLAGPGIDSVVYSIGYLGDASEPTSATGPVGPVGLRRRGRTPAWNRRRAAPRPGPGWLEEDFLVLYGDSWLQVDPAAVLRAAARASRARADDRAPQRGPVGHQQRDLRWSPRRALRKGLVARPAEMCWIDYGLLALRRRSSRSACRPTGATSRRSCPRWRPRGSWPGSRFPTGSTRSARWRSDELEALLAARHGALAAQAESAEELKPVE